MKETEHYQLKKPDPNDYAKIETLNENADRIDAALAALERSAFTHAGQHSAGGSDPVTPAAIGAATIAELAGKALGNGYVNAVDLNTVIDSGMYRVQDNCTNVPPGIYGYGQLLVIHGSGDTIAQIYFDYNQNQAYLRSGNPPDVGGPGTWSEWVLIATAEDLAGKVDNNTGVLQGNITTAVDQQDGLFLYRGTDGISPSQYSGSLISKTWDTNFQTLTAVDEQGDLYVCVKSGGTDSWRQWRKWATTDDLAGKVDIGNYQGDMDKLVTDGHYRVYENVNLPSDLRYGQVIVSRGLMSDTVVQIGIGRYAGAGKHFKFRSAIIQDGIATWDEWTPLATADALAGKLSLSGGTLTGYIDFDQGLGRATIFKNASTTADYGLVIRDYSEDGKVIGLVIHGADQKIAIQRNNGGGWHEDIIATADDLTALNTELTTKINNKVNWLGGTLASGSIRAWGLSFGPGMTVGVTPGVTDMPYSAHWVVSADIVGDGAWLRISATNVLTLDHQYCICNNGEWTGWTRTATSADLAGKVDIGFYQGDMNSLVTDGHYRLYTNSNAPPGVHHSQAIVSRGLNSDTAAQIVVGYSSSKMYFRGANVVNGVWNWYNWTRVATADDIAAITPGLFPTDTTPTMNGAINWTYG